VRLPQKGILMQGPSWITLLGKIPLTLQDTVALTLVTGAEILMQSILRLESDYTIIRGRMSGSTDAGRVIILPYDQIVNMAFTKRMLEPEVVAIFGKIMEQLTAQTDKGSSADQAAANGADSEDEGAVEVTQTAKEEPAAPVRPTQSTPATPATATSPAKNQSQPSKSILLARLRARLAERGK
jgi:hypothetical protein